MKILGRLILTLLIIVPIVFCVASLNKLWNEENDFKSVNKADISGDITSEEKSSGDVSNIDNKSGESAGIIAEMAGEQYVSRIGTPISKIYTDASISISVANVYKEADESSEVVGTLMKLQILTAQKYPENWTRVTSNKISGWMRTENISFPEGNGNNNLVGTDPTIGKSGTVKAEPYLNMRASANTTAKIITTIPKGTVVTIKDVADGWYKVTYASSTGWVSASFVTLNK